MLVAACGGGGATTAPATEAPAASEAAPSAAASEAAVDCVVGVSWNNFQQPRWAAPTSRASRGPSRPAAATYIDADANLSNEQQLTDVDTLISKGAKVLIVLAQDTKAILPALQKANDAGIPVIAYDRLIEDPSVLYITFDNVGVGKAEAEAILAKVPEGNYVLIKGDPGDPNASTFLPQGWDEAGLKAAVDAGKITILNGPDGTFTDAWKHRDRPVEHGSDHRQGRRRQHARSTRSSPRTTARRSASSARSRRRATASRPSAARTATRPT